MFTGLQGQKIMYAILFLGKVCRKNPGFDKDKTDVMFGLTLHDCIFHFPLCTSKGINDPFENKNNGPRLKKLGHPVFFFFLSFFLSYFLFQADLLERLHSLGRLGKHLWPP